MTEHYYDDNNKNNRHGLKELRVNRPEENNVLFSRLNITLKVPTVDSATSLSFFSSSNVLFVFSSFFFWESKIFNKI